MIPHKLKEGDTIRVVAPSMSLKGADFITKENESAANKRLSTLGFKLTFGKHINEVDEIKSSPAKLRIEDMHDAFSDKDVKMVLAVTGGFNSNELISSLDYDLIKKNPKIICGYSDTTTLSNAIYAKTGLVTYSGPSYFDFGEEKGLDYTIDYFKRCLFDKEPFSVSPCKRFFDWKDETSPHDNTGFEFIRKGSAEGTIVGGNVWTLQHMTGTPFMPSLKDKILFLEDDYEEEAHHLNSALTAMTLLPDFDKIKALVIGRFQKLSGIDMDMLKKIIARNNIPDVPIIANADFGHTAPFITFPIGGRARVAASKNDMSIEIIEH